MADNDLDLRYWTRQRLSRRRVLGGAAAGGAALAAIGLVGCSGDGNGNGKGGGNLPPELEKTVASQDGYQDGPGKPGGILRVRQAVNLPSMNVFGPGILVLAQGLTLGYTVFDHMWFVPTDTGVLELFLATKVEQPDSQTVIATLGDAVFHDKAPANGRKITAEDVAASFKRFRDEAPIGFSWHHHVMDDIVAVDERTVKITQKFPWAWVFTSSNAGSPIFSSIMPKEILRDHDDLLRDDAIGSGHWVLAGHDNGANLKMRKFQNFRQFQGEKSIAGQPFLNGIDFRSITDDNAAFAAFVSGDVDAHGFTNRKQKEDAESRLGDKIVTGSDLSRDYTNFMMLYEPPFDDIRVRQAFNLLINRDDIIQFIEDGDGVKTGPIPPAHKRYALPESDSAMQEYFNHDVGKAKQLLDAASFAYDDEIEMKHSNRAVDSQLAEILKGQFATGGVKIKLVQEDLVKWFSQTLNQSQFKLTCFQHLPYEDPDLPLRFYLSPKSIGRDGQNFMHYQEDKVDAAVLAAARELDEEARVKKVQEAQKVIMSEYSPMLNIYSKINFGARYAYVKGSITGRGSFGAFNRTTWLDDESRRAQS